MARRHAALITALITGLALMFALTLSVTDKASAQGLNPWNTQFYNSTNFTVPISGANPSYPSLDLTWPGAPTDAGGAAVPGVPADNFSTIFTSTQNFQGGTYDFRIVVDDQARVTIDGVEIRNVTLPGEDTVGVVLSPGAHLIQVFFIEFTLGARIQVTWSLQGGTGGGGALPGQPTFTPAPTAVPTQTALPPIPAGAQTATVIRAYALNIRDAPSLGGNRLGRIFRGQTYAVIGRDDNARWFLLQLGGYQGWAYGYYLFVSSNEFNPPIVSGNSVLGLAGQPDTGVRVQSRATLRLRAAPTVASMQTGRITWGAFLPVVGRTADGVWYQVVWKGTVGWAYSAFLDIIDGDLNNVPVR